jgi:hypothetical protein
VQFNLFDWIREGVKRSVILGVHDAVQTIGRPQDEDLRQRLSTLLPAAGGDVAAEPAITGTAKRKRLGRSLRDFDSAGE